MKGKLLALENQITLFLVIKIVPYRTATETGIS